MGSYTTLPVKISKKDSKGSSVKHRRFQDKRCLRLEQEYFKKKKFYEGLCNMSDEGLRLYIDMFYKK